MRQRAHLVRGEEPPAAAAERDLLHALGEPREVVAAAPAGQAGGERGDLDRTGCPVRLGELVDAEVDGAPVLLVLDRVPDDRLAARVDLDAAVAAVARERHERRVVLRARDEVLVRLGRHPRDRRADQPRRVLHALDQEAVAVLDVRELVHEAGLRRAPPRTLVLGVRADERDARVQAEVVADGRAADAASQEQRGRLERAARDDDGAARAP